MASAFSDPRFHDEKAAFAALEAIMWPEGPVCPHCGALDRLGKLENQRTKASKKHPEGRLIHGLWKCYHCKGKFSVRKGTIFEDSHLDLHLWFQAAFLMASSKKGVSANQLHRTLKCTLKTAWFAAHRLREAMAEGSLNPFGSGGGAVESDETYIGRRRRKGEEPRHHERHTRFKVLTLIDRDTKQARSFTLRKVDSQSVGRIVAKNVSREARMMTDQATYYKYMFGGFADHQAVDHSKEEYVRGDAHTNTAEGFFSLFKKGMKAIYQHCDEKHLHRYLAEFDFRYNHRIATGVDDSERMVAAMKGAKGKRLTYQAAGGI
jgi:transposase-like protein